MYKSDIIALASLVRRANHLRRAILVLRRAVAQEGSAEQQPAMQILDLNERDAMTDVQSAIGALMDELRNLRE